MEIRQNNVDLKIGAGGCPGDKKEATEAYISVRQGMTTQATKLYEAYE
jgi:hypothetical protein